MVAQAICRLQNCVIDYCLNGVYGANYGGSSANFKIENSTINHTNSIAIDLTNEFSYALIENNIIQNTGMMVGMGGNGGGTYQAINVSGANSIVQNNEIDNTGYIGIGFNGNNININNNLINNFCMIKDDGGGIYSGNNASGNMISGNIVLNGIGNGDGTLNSSVKRAHGIFLDDNATGVTIQNNSIANICYAAIFLHNAAGISIIGNTTYNSNIGLLTSNDNSILTSNLVVQQNILVGISSGEVFTPQNQICVQFATIHNNLSSFGNVDANYYARPIDDDKTLIATSTGVADNILNLSGWQNYLGFDLHSFKSPKTITSANDLRFEYNATTSNKTISLNANYIDVKGTNYQGSITLSPYTSAVLIRNGAITNGNIAPIANAGGNGTITLPSNSVTLSGTGTDADGTITGYSWTKISGPSANISSPNSASTNVTGMTTAGTYVFQLTVTDNNGATGTSTVQMNVLNSGSSNNIAPVANAGDKGTITLPASSVRLDGTGTDADGTITGYSWTKISGPSANISSPNSASTDVTGMTTAGTYIFQITVTDDDGATGTSTVQINVLNSGSSNNIAPVANAGGNGTITLPASSVWLDGTGTDADGTITGYSWTKISGPSANIVSPNSASTNITGMTTVGTYIFQITVTDDDGATGTSTVQINVLNSGSSNNIAPVANAGGNGTITLPASSVRLDGKGTDADGTITGYSWIKISGPSANISSPNSASTDVTGMTTAGTYIFQITVTDDDGATGTSTVQINVLNSGSSNNIAPVANAGGNGTITLPASSVRLDGTGTDADGTITGYSWTKISGPSANISSPNSASTNITGMTTVGTYIFQITVTDDDGATGTSRVQINVVNSSLSVSLPSITNTEISQVPSSLIVTAYPNPFINTLNITITGEAAKYKLIVMNAVGETMLVKVGNKNNGTTQLVIDGSKFSRGVYFLTLIQNNQSSTIKLEKQ